MMPYLHWSILEKKKFFESEIEKPKMGEILKDY